MFLSDSHTHSCCSPDGTDSILEMARAGRKAALTHMCITDHCDLLTLEGDPSYGYDWKPYKDAFHYAQNRLPQELDLARGLELGGAYENPDAARAVLAGEPRLDFVIGSVHNFRNMMDKKDFSYADYADRDVCLQALKDYLGSLEALIELPDCYDVLGHILYPLRYMNVKHGQEVSLAEDDNLAHLAVILRKVAEDGKGIEINTWRGQTVEDWEPILRLFKALGGEIVTVGSDAHCTGDVAKGVREAYKLMSACGFGYVAAFRGRKAQMKRL